MRKIDHVRKTVYIIVGCLTIVSLVLTICHKVGHCAESIPNNNLIPISTFPIPYGTCDIFSDPFTIGVYDYYVTDSNISSLLPNVPGSNRAILFSELANHSYYVDVYVMNNASISNVLSLTPNDSVVYYSYSYCEVRRLYPDGHSTFQREITTDLTCQVHNMFSGLDDSYFDLQAHAYGYPIYFENPSYSCSYNNNLIFQEYSDFNSNPPFPGGHTKGGVLSNYIDSDELLEDDSQLPSVDITPPSDPSSNAGWFQKILNGIAKVNQSIKGGVLTLGDFIGQGFENVLNWLTEPFDSEQFNTDLNDIALINDFSNLKTQVENCGMFDWSDVTPAQSLSFTFDVGGAVLPHTSCVVDFSWYTGTVKNICVAVICTFLVLGLLVTIINQLPNIIGGKSGDKGGGSDS